MPLSFPLKLVDISLWLAITALILLVTSEVLSSRTGMTSIQVNIKRLEKAAVIVSISFLITIFITIIRLFYGA